MPELAVGLSPLGCGIKADEECEDVALREGTVAMHLGDLPHGVDGLERLRLTENSIRILAPLTIQDQILTEGMTIFEEVFKQLA